MSVCCVDRVVAAAGKRNGSIGNEGVLIRRRLCVFIRLSGVEAQEGGKDEDRRSLQDSALPGRAWERGPRRRTRFGRHVAWGSLGLFAACSGEDGLWVVWSVMGQNSSKEGTWGPRARSCNSPELMLHELRRGAMSEVVGGEQVGIWVGDVSGTTFLGRMLHGRRFWCVVARE